MRDRFSCVLDPDFKCCKPPFSFYRFIEKYWPTNGQNRTLHRIFSLARKMNAQTVTVEELARRGELEVEVNAIEKRCGGAVAFKAWRFSFFAEAVSRDTLPYVNDEDHLGYAVLVLVRLPDGTIRGYIYESVMVEPSFDRRQGVLSTGLPAHYVHCVRRYPAWVAGHRFTLSGSFFSQQNGLTNVCAHAALRWLFNNLPERTHQVVSYEEINKSLEINHVSRKVGCYGTDVHPVGLPMDDLLMAIKNQGYKYVRAEWDNTRGTPLPYWRFVYSIIESGYPVLVFFQTERARHVICVIGHTLNSDIWDEEARRAYSGAPRALHLSTASWADHFIIHDDNYGMYFCMPSKALLRSTREGGPFQITGALGIVPAEVELHPLEAEVFASVVLHYALAEVELPKCYWLEALKQEEAAFGKWVVLRTLLTSKALYHEHVRAMEDVGGDALTEAYIGALVHSDLPEHFWVTEITLTDIYTANKRKIGEILFRLDDPGIKEDDTNEVYLQKLFEACLAIRLPGSILIPEAGQDPKSLQPLKTALTGHVPLLRMCRPAPPSEW